MIEDVAEDFFTNESVAGRFAPESVKHRFRRRGAVSVDVSINETEKVRLMTSHPIVFARAISRARQIRLLNENITSNTPLESKLILGADMNHYPSPRRVDLGFAEEANLSNALSDEITWRLKDSPRLKKLNSISNKIKGCDINFFDAQLDALLYRGFDYPEVEVIDIVSDHKAIVAKFKI